jgi:sugar/nucleoside kinase (ribokinase family)
MSLNFDVIVIGSYSVDLIFSGLAEYPQLGINVVGKDFMMTSGEVFISAVSMQRLGIKVGWAADFGNDDFSRYALKYTHEEGLDESLFVIHDCPYRRVSVAASYPDDRAIITYYDPDPQIPVAIPALLKSNAKVLFIQGLYFGEFFDLAISIIHLKKMHLAMDGNSSTGEITGKTWESKAIRKAIKSVGIFLPNAQEAKRLTGEQNLETATLQLAELCPIVIIKDGSNGSLACTNNKFIQVPAIPINPIDTTCAGDNFNSGFLNAWLDGQTIETCL